MRKTAKNFSFGLFFLLLLLTCNICQSSALAREAIYPTMAPIDQYLMPESAEIALARSAASSAISAHATVMVLGRKGYTTVARGKNDFLCIVERSWGNQTTDANFWNPKIRAPICFNPKAAETFAPIYLMKTKLVLARKSKEQIAMALRKLPALAPGSMCYMMSKRQYLTDQGKNWYPHVMFFVPRNIGTNMGSNLSGSPIIVAEDPQEHVNVIMVLVDHWSDGTPSQLAMR